MSEPVQGPPEAKITKADRDKKRQDKKKARSRVLDYLVYLAARVVVCFVQALPFETASGFGKFLAWLAFKVDRRHRQVARENLEQAFPNQLSPQEIDARIRQVYSHFLSMLIEILHMPRRLHAHNWKRHAHLVEAGPLVDLLLSGRSVLLVTGHFGNWELAGYALALFGFKTHAIARPLDNPYLDDFLRSFRERTGQKLLAKNGDFDKIEKTLAGGGILATLADQDAGERGLFVEFFGRPASTHKAVALMALEHQVAMAVVGAPKIDSRYMISTGDIILPEEYARVPAAIKTMTQRFTSALEKLIRLAPEQYFWVHRRWKHKPPEKKTKKAA